jgi:hypothetical protein
MLLALLQSHASRRAVSLLGSRAARDSSNRPCRDTIGAFDVQAWTRHCYWRRDQGAGYGRGCIRAGVTAGRLGLSQRRRGQDRNTTSLHARHATTAKTFHASSAPDTHANHGSAAAMSSATPCLRAGSNETAGDRGTC